ncbi:MAG: hypothetical protein ACYCW6_07165 [Candidatus Xenobia bacterium]
MVGLVLSITLSMWSGRACADDQPYDQAPDHGRIEVKYSSETLAGPEFSGKFNVVKIGAEGPLPLRTRWAYDNVRIGGYFQWSAVATNSLASGVFLTNTSYADSEIYTKLGAGLLRSDKKYSPWSLYLGYKATNIAGNELFQPFATATAVAGGGFGYGVSYDGLLLPRQNDHLWIDGLVSYYPSMGGATGQVPFSDLVYRVQLRDRIGQGWDASIGFEGENQSYQAIGNAALSGFTTGLDFRF